MLSEQKAFDIDEVMTKLLLCGLPTNDDDKVAIEVFEEKEEEKFEENLEREENP